VTRHLTSDQFQKYKERKIPTSELLAIGDHLAECRDCREKLGGTEERAAILHSLTRDVQSALLKNQEHLTYQQIAGYVDEILNPIQLEIVQSHLDICARCKSELEDLAKFQKQLSKEQISKKSFVSSVAFQNKFAVMLPRMIAVAAALVVVALLVAIPFQLQINNLKAQLKGKAQQTSTSRVELQDGSLQIGIDEKGNVWSLKRFLPEQQQLIRAALTDQHLSIPSFVHELIGPAQGSLRTPKQKVNFAVTKPVGTAIITDQPEFRWNALQGAQSYRVRIYDPDYNRIAESPELNSTSWNSQVNLARGKNYSWTVTAKTNSGEILSPAPPAAEAKFRVLSPFEVDEINRQVQQNADSHLLLALLYIQNGLIDDADQELQALKRANPDSTIAENLLRNLQSLRSNH
jgi:hypothetical protein